MPDPVPMHTFRGQPLTHELAEDIFIGWLAEKTSSLDRGTAGVGGSEGEEDGGSEVSGGGGSAQPATGLQRFSWRVFSGK
jgi:hypothetical protein